MSEVNNFDSIQIGVASPEKIRSWSHGEVTKPETINYRTQKPEKDGLFCERIFGPTKDWECNCGKYKRVRYKGVICDKCGVEVTKKIVRRERMGHIELACPVSHIWYFKGVPSRISIALDMSPKDVEHVLYYSKYVVIDPGRTDFLVKQVIDDKEYLEAIDKFGQGSFKAGRGAEAVKELLMAIDLDKESKELKDIVATTQGQRRIKAVKRLEVIESFRISNNRPEWMILDVLPVLPPELRPMVPLDGGRYAASDLNDLYRRVINRNNRLKKLIEMGSPEIIIINEKRMLQEAVDALIDNGRRGKPVTGAGNRELKSLTSMLKGKQGRFRQNLLGKRVDYSGRSVIVVGPELKMYQCGIPKEMALELFKPFVTRKLIEYGKCQNPKAAKKILSKAQDLIIWDILEEVIKDHPVLLNRAPSLHRLSIQAFEPVLVEGRAIKLHPLVCGAFNADFDGDQMAVHVPLSVEARAEARFLMLSTNNILKLSDGKAVVSPSQDMVIGSYYLTIDKDGGLGEGRCFRNANEALMAYQDKQIELQSKIRVRVEKVIDGQKYSKILNTTLGRIIFNTAIPQDLHFVPRDTPEQQLDLEIDMTVGKKELSKIVERCFKYKGATETSVILDKIKAQGFKYSTIGAITTSVFDMHVPKNKKEVIARAEEAVQKQEKLYKRGLIDEQKRYESIVDIWKKAKEEIDKELETTLGRFNPIWMMAKSGARGNISQISQLCSMKGLVQDPSGKVIELPVKASFREGLSVLEYFISSHGGRKGMADTALKTAESGYLTRRLVDVAQEVIVSEQDCGDTKGIVVVRPMRTQKMTDDDYSAALKDFVERIDGRFAIDDVINPVTGEVICAKDEMITADMADVIKSCGVAQVHVRTVMTCKSKYGVCAKCYGKNMASNNPVKLGEAVGIIAAQSIGEPGTQLTMRTFHTGGVATDSDITGGLPRVQELFEARRPKGIAVVSGIKGKISINEEKHIITVTPESGEPCEYKYSFNQKLAEKNGVTLKEGDIVEAGDPLTQGSIYPPDILNTKGVNGVLEYIIREVKATYSKAGVDINEKHIEIIVRQMLRKVRIEMQGDTHMIPGELVDLHTFEEENQRVLEEGGVPAISKRVLLGITKASLATESFLSAASFQETARVLTEAAIRNKIDNLRGLKENVILGKLIPAGTGMKRYRNIVALPSNSGENEIVEDQIQDKFAIENDIED
ncbi:MAG: DNA-directed RNA polymerase subunit beta' [Christensenellales bacterium]